MSDTHETIADIIAEKRRQADEIERDVAEKMKRNAMISDRYARELVADIRREADRLEAAHRRELSKNVSKNGADFGQLGDAAKLREALVKCREIALQWQADEAAGVAGTTDKPHSRSAAEAVVDMEFEINAALSAPPRNCDVYTSDELKVIFKSELVSGLPIANEHEKNLIAITAMGVIDTLLAPATEKEGGGR